MTQDIVCICTIIINKRLVLMTVELDIIMSLPHSDKHQKSSEFDENNNYFVNSPKNYLLFSVFCMFIELS